MIYFAAFVISVKLVFTVWVESVYDFIPIFVGVVHYEIVESYFHGVFDVEAQTSEEGAQVEIDGGKIDKICKIKSNILVAILVEIVFKCF